MQAGTLAVTLFGKIPRHGDFVRRNAAGGVVQAVDAWLQKGVYAARTRLGPAFEAAYDRAGPWAFCFDPPEAPSVLVGVMQPSSDRVGRRFPLLVGLAAEAPALAQRIRVPVDYRRFFEQAAPVVREAAAGAVAQPDLAARLDPPPVDGPGGEAVLSDYLRKTPLVSFWERLWDYREDSRKYVLFKNLLDVLLPLRAGALQRSPLVLRFPLCPDGRTLSFDVSFWLEVCRRLLGLPGWRPSFFWSQAKDAARERPFLLVTLAAPPPATFTYLLSGTGDTLCVLETLSDGNAALAALSIPAHYGRMLEAEDLTLQDFLQRL